MGLLAQRTMSELTVREVLIIVWKYFDDIKRAKFIFDIVSVELDDNGEWHVKCEVANVFDEEPHVYEVYVDDETGEITDVAEVSE